MPTRSSSSAKVFYRSFDRSGILDHLRSRIDALQKVLPASEVILFGSCAQDRHTVASDIDVLIIYNDPPDPSAYASARKALEIQKLEPHVYAQSEADANRSVVDRMVADGIRVL